MRCLREHLIKSSNEMFDDLMQNGVYTPQKRRYENRQAPPRPFALGWLMFNYCKSLLYNKSLQIEIIANFVI